MSRRKGSPNRHPSFVSNDRIKSKAKKLAESVEDYLALVNRNRFAFAETDFNKWEDVTKELKYIIDTNTEK